MPDHRLNSEKKFWERFASRYDKFIWWVVPKTYHTIIDNIVPYLKKSDKLLEAGTGPGLISLALLDHVSYITAFDLADAMIEVAEKKKKDAGLINIVFEVQDVCKLPYEDNSFDVVVSSNLLHLLHEPSVAINELKRILKAEGILITPTFCHNENIKSRIYSEILSLSSVKTKNKWTTNGFREFLESNGLEVMKFRVIKDKIPLAFVISKKN
jgi:ubiquinone/menaquinone biosynthesis C-methylase UbiE